MTKVGCKTMANPMIKRIPDPFICTQVMANILNVDSVSTSSSVPQSKPTAIPTIKSYLENVNKVKRGEGMSIFGISRSFRPKHTGVIYFPVKARAPAPQRQSIPRFRPIIDLQRIRISPSLQLAGYQNMRDAIVAEEPSISSMCYKSSRFRINAKGELVPIQDPRVHVKEETAPVTEEPASEESNMERQDLQRTSVSRVGAKWWLFLLCIALLWYMRSGGETNHHKLLETNQESTNLRTRIQRNRDSEFEFMQMLAYEMSKRSNIDPMALG